MSVFESLPPDLQTALHRLGITVPTAVQQAALPPALRGRDVLATAQTGTGKTLAFLLPLIVRLREKPDQNALILSPTRELAQQTQQVLQTLLPREEENFSVLIIGGDNIHKQYALLRRKPRVIIGTPGRVLDHIGRKSLSLKNTGFFILDEADRMLDMGFIPDVRKIGSAMPVPRQTFLFSATLPAEIEALSCEFMQAPARVQIGSVSRPADLVLQQFVRLNTHEKLPQLVHELQTRKGSILIFVKSRRGAERLVKQLKLYDCKAGALHGDLRQSRRRQVMEAFRLADVPALVATDVAARGLDVADISCVINYDLPLCPQDYIHRIGRTGRAGGVGTALSFVSEDEDKWKEICRVCRLDRIDEITKTSRPLPKPKFTLDAAHKKEGTPDRIPKRRPVGAPKDTARVSGKSKACKKVISKKLLSASVREIRPSAAVLASAGESAARAGFRVVAAGRKKRQSMGGAIKKSSGLYGKDRKGRPVFSKRAKRRKRN